MAINSPEGVGKKKGGLDCLDLSDGEDMVKCS